MFKSNFVSKCALNNKYENKLHLSFFKFFLKNYCYLYQIEIIFKLASKSENENRFILMLILMEKFLNMRLIFLFDKKTLSRSKIIKVGYIINLQKENLHFFLYFSNIHNLSKYYNSIIFFDFSCAYLMKYENKKILFNIISNFDKDLSYYYDYLNEFDYVISFFFKTFLNNSFLNKLLLYCYGFFFIYVNNYNIFNFEFVNNTNLLDEEVNDKEQKNDILMNNNDLMEKNKIESFLIFNEQLHNINTLLSTYIKLYKNTNIIDEFSIFFNKKEDTQLYNYIFDFILDKCCFNNKTSFLFLFNSDIVFLKKLLYFENDIVDLYIFTLEKDYFYFKKLILNNKTNNFMSFLFNDINLTNEEKNDAYNLMIFDMMLSHFVISMEIVDNFFLIDNNFFYGW